MKIIIASDHGGIELKKQLIKYLKNKKDIDIIDGGTNSKDSVDYPIYGFKAAEAVKNKEADRGIIICGTGLGISMAANRIKGIRAALCHDTYLAKMSKLHNNSNVLALGGRTTEYKKALDIVETWLSTKYEGGRHERRLKMLDNH